MEVELWQRPPTRRAEDPTSRPTTTAAHWPACSHALVRGMTSPRGTPCAGCTHNTAGDPNREHDFASRMVDLFRAVTLAHRHAPKSQRALAPSRGRPHHERAQTTPACDSGDTQHPHARPPTHLLGTNPIDAAWGESTHTQCHGKISRLPPPTAARRAGGPLGPHVCNAQRRGSGHNLILPGHERQGNTYLQLLSCCRNSAPGDHDCGSAHHHQRGMGRH
jgi:hypothetical protein